MYQHLYNIYKETNTEFKQYPYVSLFGSKTIPTMLSTDFRTLSHVAELGDKKSERRLENIRSQISKMKKGQIKKYQVSGRYEAKIIQKYCNDNNIFVTIIESKTLEKNKVYGIHKGYDSECCSECNGKISFDSEKVPVMYVEVNRNKKMSRKRIDERITFLSCKVDIPSSIEKYICGFL
jgi:hypothetical protein